MAKLIWPGRDQILELRNAQYDRERSEAFLSFWARRLNAMDVRTKINPAAYLVREGVGYFFDHLDRLSGGSVRGTCA